MITIEQIKRPILKEFNEFEDAFEKAFKTDNELLNSVNQYILQKRGKQIRPILTILSAKLCGKYNENTIRSAISLEMLHTASLIHDDIVDNTFERRGQKSVNAIWDNKVSILVGDYLLSQSLATANKTQNHKILDQITSLGKEISEGELLQIANVQDVAYNEDKYLNVIKKKTAALFSTCTYAGASSVNATDEEAEKLKKFGEIYGICFQIKDDIFDYISTEQEIGKPIGNDICEGKITLPLIYALNKTSEDKRKKYLSLIEKKLFTKENIDSLIQFSIKEGGIQYAEKRMQDFKNEAIKTIDSFENNIIKETILLTLEHTIERKK